MTVSADKIARAIRRSDLTMDELDLIGRSVVAKRESVARAFIRALKPGTRVELGENTRPQYMRYMVGTVQAVRRTKVEVLLDDVPQGKRFGRKLVVPAALLRLHTVEVEEPPTPDVYSR